MAPFSARSSLPSTISFPWNNDTVYFSEIVLSQLISGGSGYGTFAVDMISAPDDVKAEVIVEEMQGAQDVNPGSLLR